MEDALTSHEGSYMVLDEPKYSNWQCHLFGTGSYGGMVWTPLEGQVPNAFWRLMQFLILGFKWKKISK